MTHTDPVRMLRDWTRKAALSGGLVVAALTLTGCPHTCPVSSLIADVDPAGNGVLEPGKPVAVEPSWRYGSLPSRSGCPINNPCPASALVDGNITSFDGPAGGVYTILDGAADYGVVSLNTTKSCSVAGDCYQLSVTAPSGRPAVHWDATLAEQVTGGSTVPSPTSWILPMSASVLAPDACPILYGARTWTLHIGKSFEDVGSASGFYPYIENIFHHGVTAGCDVNQYCPDQSIRRDQMAVFLLKSVHGAGYVPPACSGVFTDVPCPGPFTDWVEQVHAEEIIGDCGSDKNFCPGDLVERRDMASWLLKAHEGSTYVPPAATGLFADVSIDDADAPWIEDLYRRQITAGCNASPLLYCPDRSNTRGQMAVFIAKTWGLRLY